MTFAAFAHSARVAALGIALLAACHAADRLVEDFDNAADFQAKG